MLDKIKIYRRSDAKEVDELCVVSQNGKLFLVDYAGFTLNEATNNMLSCVIVAELSKTDPLNKFKKEMDGWWFSQDYVVMINGNKNYTIQYHAGPKELGYIEVNPIQNNIDLNYDVIDVIFTSHFGSKKLHILNIEEYIQLENFFQIKLSTKEKYQIGYSALGEDKYIKFFELINK